MRHVPRSSLCAVAVVESDAASTANNASESRRVRFRAGIRISCDIGAPEQGDGRQTAPAIGSPAATDVLNGRKSACGPIRASASAVDREPVYVDDQADDRLERADDKQRHIMPALPEPQPQSAHDRRRHYRQKHEAEDVVAVGDVRSTNRARREIMSAEAGNK